MSDDTMPIEDYIAQGGVLTAPENMPARYRGEMMRLMSSFVDSELSASAGFADAINLAPAIRERIAASRITLEKADHALRVLQVMEGFGTDLRRYQASHDWSARLTRDADLGPARTGTDNRLAVFHYPLNGWTDAVVMNVLQGLATEVQMEELTRVSYGPLADVFRDIAPREAQHVDMGIKGLSRIITEPDGRDGAVTAITYWRPRVAATFGVASSQRFGTLQKFGLRHTSNEDLLARWERLVEARLAPMGLTVSTA
ncbi:MAG: phenylacetic acid catabolic [Paracoccus denitrificans]|nr:MAG: phenylacetic acid catabolic [Paracoccus denitrificans]PZO84293.1 MAG: phenylacetic acid catabolic [Paracoccus denitrificans]